MPFAIASVLRKQRQNNQPMVPKLTRFQKVTAKMLQHGASDGMAEVAAEPRPGKEVSGQPVSKPVENYSVKREKFKPVTIVINVGVPA